jgi:transposase-like protein
MFAALDECCEHGAITRVARRHGVSRRTLSRRWCIYRDAVQSNDVATQHAMCGFYDRRRDNRLAVPRDVERRTIDALLDTNQCCYESSRLRKSTESSRNWQVD